MGGKCLLNADNRYCPERLCFPDLGMENQVRIYNRTCHLQVHKWLKQNHFKDSVTVKEMKEAFYQNYKYATSNNPYAGFDSLTAPLLEETIIRQLS